MLMPEHLSPAIAASRRTIPASERTLEPTEVVVRLDQPMAAATEHLERALLQFALKRCGGRDGGDRRAAGTVAQGPLSETAALRHRAARKRHRQSFWSGVFVGTPGVPASLTTSQLMRIVPGSRTARIIPVSASRSPFGDSLL